MLLSRSEASVGALHPPACMHWKNVAITSPSVDGGERAIMFDRVSGVLETPVSEGTHFRVPYLQTPNVMDIRTRPRSISSVTGTKGEGFVGGYRGVPLPNLFTVAPVRTADSRCHAEAASSPLLPCAPSVTVRRSPDGQHHPTCAFQAGCRETGTHVQGGRDMRWFGNGKGTAVSTVLGLQICVQTPSPAWEDVSLMVHKPHLSFLLLPTECLVHSSITPSLSRTWASTGMSVCCRPSAMRCSSLWWRSTRPSSC